jgi:putative endonuclease
MAGGYIYILGSHTGTLSIGVTSNLYVRVMQHKEARKEAQPHSHDQSRVQRHRTDLGMEDDYSP